MHDIMEGTKIDTALRATTNATSLTGPYFSMTKYAKALFLLTIQGQLDGASLDFKVYQSLNAAGGTPLQLGATIAMAQGIKLAEAGILMNSPDVDDTVIIQPYSFVGGVLTAGTALTFTAKTAQSLPNRQYDQSGNVAAQATSLAACINDATYGVPGVLATVDTATVVLTADEPGECLFTVTESDVAKTVVTDLVQQAAFEVAVQDLTRDSDYTHVGARVSGVDATTEFACVLIRAMPGYGPVNQAVAYSDDAS
jgi:hypothetical protein